MASEPIRVEERINFGDDFELEVSARRLRRRGHALKMERIPLEILVLLLERHGEIVTRDEIVAKVWGKGAFLDTDNSIRGAIRKIRQVLKDDPEYPQFIQTVTGQGYRFIARLRAEEETKADPGLGRGSRPHTEPNTGGAYLAGDRWCGDPRTAHCHRPQEPESLDRAKDQIAGCAAFEKPVGRSQSGIFGRRNDRGAHRTPFRNP